jgi:hypothetical protein
MKLSPLPGKLLCMFLALSALVFAAGAADPAAAQTKVDPINFDWRFAKGDQAAAKDPVL